MKRLKVDLHIPDYVTDVVDGALKTSDQKKRQQALSKLATKLGDNLPKPEQKPLKLGDLELAPGVDVDVKDCQDNWLPGVIKELQGTQIYVHYYKWNARWDEWVEVGHGRVAPPVTYTSKQAWGRRKGGASKR
ncbi:unnamed protein product [Choristocarpus tenellus]